MGDDAKLNLMVYALVRRIPPGRVLTYGRVAALIGMPRGAREVGWALSNLPAGSDVPWHRVVNAEGRISVRGPGAAEAQRERLIAEGVKFDKDDPLKLQTFDVILWSPAPLEVQADLEGETKTDPEG